MADHRIGTPDGRTLQVLEAGAPDGVPVMFVQGMPNSRFLYRPWVELAQHRGIRLISYDRPGYGGSDRNPGRTVADCTDDIRAIAAGLGIERLALFGHSGG
ncbi:MAG: alpha/beta fold hydrolase, partial [Solirubrobacteraceae bacterium]